MKDTPPHLRALEEVEEAGIAGLLEVLREEGLTVSGTPCGTQRAGTATTLPPPGAIELRRSRRGGAGRWR
jgi:hypothetical protein